MSESKQQCISRAQAFVDKGFTYTQYQVATAFYDKIMSKEDYNKLQAIRLIMPLK
jgi:hypothetical protein